MELLNTTDLVNLLYAKLPYPKDALMRIYSTLLDTMTEEFLKGNSIRMTGICVLSVKEFHNTRKCPVATSIGNCTGMRRMDTYNKHLRFRESKGIFQALNKGEPNDDGKE